MPASLKFHLREPSRPIPGHARRPSGDAWLVCCQSIDEHRFDCDQVPPDKRGAGPVLRIAPAARRAG